LPFIITIGEDGSLIIKGVLEIRFVRCGWCKASSLTELQEAQL